MSVTETKASQINREVKALEEAFVLETNPNIKERLDKIIDRKIADFVKSYVEEMSTKLGRLISLDEDDVEERRR